jgi:hypothetical protein
MLMDGVFIEDLVFPPLAAGFKGVSPNFVFFPLIVEDKIFI